MPSPPLLVPVHPPICSAVAAALSESIICAGFVSLGPGGGTVRLSFLSNSRKSNEPD